MLELFVTVCLVILVVFFFSPYELTVGEDED